MVSLVERSFLWVAFVFVSAFLITLMTTQIAFAHEFSTPFRWFSSTVKVEDRTTSYSREIDLAVSDYDSNTVMSWSEATPSNMVYLEANWGNTIWDAGAVAYSKTVKCMDFKKLSITGYCNTTDRKADYAYIYLNTYDRDDLDDLIDTAVVHEPGHALGMGHTDCTTISIMKRGTCFPPHVILRSHDKLHINSWYGGSGN